MDPPEPEARPLQCAYCPKAFGRTEHLRRHELIHTKQRQFNCSVCGKVFTRRDALQRHELTHQATSPSLLSKGSRACLACRTAKVRCSGELCCTRCHQRGLDCAYPDTQDGNVRQTPDQSNTVASSSSSGELVPSPALPVGQQPALFTPMVSQPTYDAISLEADFWDPNILSASNWLDGVIEADFPYASPQFAFHNNATPGFSFPQQPAWNQPYPVHVPQHQSRFTPREHAISPVAVASTTSGQSKNSAAESAADVCAAPRQDGERRKGEYYVDGEAARLPRTKRRKLSSRLMSRPVGGHSLSLFTLRTTLNESTEDLKHRIHLPASTYEQLLKAWQSICLSNLGPWISFETSDFPTKEVLEHLLGLYFVSFHPTLPFIHPATFDCEKKSWILILAMIAIGARYLTEPNADALSISLQEFFRRCLFYQKEVVDWAPMDLLTLAQCRILAFVGMTWSGDARLLTYGLDMQTLLASSFADVMVACRSQDSRQTIDNGSNWNTWTQAEQTRRTAHALFLVDDMVAYQFQRRPLIPLNDCEAPLPCNEKYWNVSDVEAWQALPTHPTSPSLLQALQELYVDKRVPRERGEFARIIMLHGIFSRSWEVAHYFSDALSQWEPTAKKQSSTDVLPDTPVWPPSVPTYAKWQSSACDCLDVLHWQANATIGQASGLEHPTVAFLHLSRVVLLSPIDSIVRLAEAISTRSDLSAVAKDKQFIQRWAVQGQYKARLAAIHAGVVYWHLRRYSIDGFYEAPAVGLAALMLWAFGTFSQPNGQHANTNAPAKSSTGAAEQSKDGTDEDSEGSACGIILLDRPTDDELVQQFIRKGHTMRANMTGVGDLYGPKGPERVLLEGCKLLATLKCWGVGTRWMDLLQGLAESCKKG